MASSSMKESNLAYMSIDVAIESHGEGGKVYKQLNNQK